MMTQNNPSNDRLEAVNVVPGSKWVLDTKDPFQRNIIEITAVKNAHCQWKYVVLDGKPWNSSMHYSRPLKDFHQTWIALGCEKDKANEMGLSVEDYQAFVEDKESEEREWQKYLVEKRGHDKFYDREEAPI